MLSNVLCFMFDVLRFMYKFMHLTWLQNDELHSMDQELKT